MTPRRFHYLRTQITRTTADAASFEPCAATTPLAFRKSRTVSAGTSTDCAGAAVTTPATIAGFNSARPANLPLSSRAAAPEKPTAGAGDNARSLPLPTGVTVALTVVAVRPPP